MAFDIDEFAPRKPRPGIVVGEDLSALSVSELEARIAALEDEIQRVRSALSLRASTRTSADAVFKR